MIMLNLPKMLWNLRRAARYLGRGGTSAIFIFIATGLFALTALMPAQEQLESTKTDWAGLRAKAAFSSGVERPADVTSVSQLAAFYSRFPHRSLTSESMAKLYAAADEQHINLERGEYRLNATKSDYLTRYELVLPVKGSYVAIRKFVIQALIDVPTLALDNITFHRQKSDDVSVEAELRFTLFLRPG